MAVIVPDTSILHYQSTKQNKGEQRRPGNTIGNCMRHGSSPGARPLVIDVSCYLRHPQARQAVFIRPPLVALGGIGGYPAKGLRGLGVRHFGRKHRDKVVVSHTDGEEGNDGSSVDEVKSREQVG